ncbi:anti-sigma B factor antagonist [Enterovibrio norvegicus FF-33]|uniref:Anti-sigma B factor antagonist n=1 Tax=Enterovibrio norvegicus FF-454 TaxID=1185651 RepID=A0A1E5BXC6_9GAMM|nr:STAS domain-containing protein [Enterovibrio norvegicus]OEE57943.1 anti-sigma B factor antagonist [Enterovibrio norvegicus FF-454]OEE70582.1 anti-sigma B factor antagonist [Enterovibrio norvegicus FF-33]OEE90421.1 anti-sigma B factor antagonist [Enterovibrio norvegicus FF-162]
MSESLAFERRINGDYCLSGELDRDTVPPFWSRRTDWLPKDSHIVLDLSSVKRVDSAGMAMLLHLQQQLKINQQTLALSNIPSQLKVLLQLSNVERFFTDDTSSVHEE